MPKRVETSHFLTKTKTLTFFYVSIIGILQDENKYMIFIEINKFYLKYRGGGFVQQLLVGLQCSCIMD